MRTVWLTGCFAFGVFAHGSALMAATEPPPPAYRPLRYEEDWRVLRTSTRAADLWDPVKFIPLNAEGTSFLSLGGEVRLRLELFNPPGFGLRGTPVDDFLLSRTFLHADVHMGELLRAFVQVGLADQTGRDTATLPTDRNGFELAQGFVDVVPLDTAELGLNLRIGRQEMTYGTNRLFALRDAANWRRNYDGFRATVRSGEVRLDGFWVRPVLIGPGSLDDRSDDREQFWGVYTVVPARVLPEGRADLFYLGIDRRSATFALGTAPEVRHTFGVRLWGNPTPWNYELEAIFQTGTFGNQTIRAWTLASNVTYTFTNAPLTPTLGLRLTAASGDNDPNDAVLETFNPLFPNPTAVSPAAALSPTNFFEIHPSLELHPARNLTFNLDWNALWKLAVRDAIYRPPGLAILTSASSNNQSWIGHQLVAQSQWQIDRHLSLVVVYVHFFSGSAITDAGGRDLDFVGSWLTYRF